MMRGRGRSKHGLSSGHYCVGEKVTMHVTKISPKIITHSGQNRSHHDSDSLEELISISSRSYSNRGLGGILFFHSPTESVIVMLVLKEPKNVWLMPATQTERQRISLYREEKDPQPHSPHIHSQNTKSGWGLVLFSIT